MRAVLAVSEFLASVCNFAGRAAAWLLFPLMLIIVGDVVLRRYYAIGSIRLQELEWHLHAMLFMLCVAHAYLVNAHVRIELVRDFFTDRLKLFVEIVGLCVLMLPLCWVLFDYSWDLVLRSYAANENSPHPSGLPYRWLIKAVMPVGYALLGLSGMSVLLRAVVMLFGPHELRRRARPPIFGSSQSAEVPVADAREAA